MEITENILLVVQRYVDRKITRARAAALLKLSERQITRLVAELGLERKQSVRAREEEAAAKRRLAKTQAAQAVISGQITIAQAAVRAGCHVRTIKRQIEQLNVAKKRSVVAKKRTRR